MEMLLHQTFCFLIILFYAGGLFVWPPIEYAKEMKPVMVKQLPRLIPLSSNGILTQIKMNYGDNDI